MDEDVLACVHVAEVAHLRFWPSSNHQEECRASEAPSRDASDTSMQTVKLSKRGPAAKVAVCVAALSAAGEVFGGAAGSPKVELVLDVENNHRDVVDAQVQGTSSSILVEPVPTNHL